MNRDYFSGAFLQLTELQPPLNPFQDPFDLTQASSSAVSYDMTAGAGAEGGEGPPASDMPPAHHQLIVNNQDQDQQNRRVSPFEEFESISTCEMPPVRDSTLSSRRRKASSFGAGSTYDEDTDDSHSTRTLPDKKQNHSEIEKRRRDKMNTYISELSALVPMCGAMARKLDKLTVLRMAVQHLRTVRGAISTGPLTACPRPAYVTERELNDLVLAAGQDACLLVVGCDRGRLLYVSASVTNITHYDKSELIGQSLFDILHPKDVAKVKEQLSSSDLSPRERLIDAKTMLPVKADTGGGATRFCPGARRSFFCRIKCKNGAGGGIKEEHEHASNNNMRKKNYEKKYCVVQCTGYLKSWAPAEMTESGDGYGSGGEDESCSASCLVAVGRALHHLAPPALAPPAPAQPRPPARKVHFMSRHANDGKYLFVDQRVTMVLGFLPQELLGTSVYELVSGAALRVVARAHRAALGRPGSLRTPPYAARRKDGSTTHLQTHFKPFRNPWTKDVECLLALNTLVLDAPQQDDCNSYLHNEDCSMGAGMHGEAGGEGGAGSDCDAEVQRLIDSHVESHKIGSAIAEDAQRRSPAACVLDLPPDLLHEALFGTSQFCDSVLDPQHQIRNNVTLSAAAGESPEDESGGPGLAGDGEEGGSPDSMTMDGNGEAAMAVIMSLLEADAGLGGPVNFSGLPWPLP